MCIWGDIRIQSTAHACCNQPSITEVCKRELIFSLSNLTLWQWQALTVWYVSFLTFLRAHTNTWAFLFTYKVFLWSGVLCTGFNPKRAEHCVSVPGEESKHCCVLVLELVLELPRERQSGSGWNKNRTRSASIMGISPSWLAGHPPASLAADWAVGLWIPFSFLPPSTMEWEGSNPYSWDTEGWSVPEGHWHPCVRSTREHIWAWYLERHSLTRAQAQWPLFFREDVLQAQGPSLLVKWESKACMHETAFPKSFCSSL